MGALRLIARPLLPYLIALGAVLALWGTHKVQVAWAHHTGIEAGRAEVQAVLTKERGEWDADKKQRAAAIANLATLWNAERLKAEQAGRALEESRRAQFAPIHQAARELPAPVARIVFPALALRVLDDAVAASNAAGAARSAGGIPGAAAGAADDSTVADVTGWGATVAELYRTCTDRVAALVTFYDGVRAAQPKGK